MTTDKKISIGTRTYLYPMPCVIVGALVNGKPNYSTIAYIGIVQHMPPMIAFASHRTHYTNIGIREHRTFSVNIPSEKMVEVTDYVGMVSGRNVDKSEIFTSFYGKLASAPMIRECPINIECRVVQVVDVGASHEIFVGEIVDTLAAEFCLTNGLPDMGKMKPIAFSMHDNNYWKIGEHLGKAWSVGKEYKQTSK
ncbi:MAG TPA: flavin reductase family protein [Dissulfurispiraceae bacterium]|nr:flavin reductase family protein [Dissulfurispiraceae bacterium]